MGISLARVDEHIKKWERPFSRDHRKPWPSHLFRHEELSNAVKILQSNRLLSRREAEAVDHDDHADQAIVNNNARAHPFVRLYFRPRNPTQYRIEGIRFESECYGGDPNVHSPVLFMFVFRTRTLLTIPTTQFSNSNMQTAAVHYGPSLEDFDRINFNLVYHDASLYGLRNAREITQARCAEVLVEPPFVVRDHLKCVLCRSEAERQTLLHALGQSAEVWRDKIRVYSRPGIFFSEWAYVRSVAPSSEQVAITFNPRKDRRHFKFSVTVRNDEGRKDFGPWSRDGSSKDYRLGHQFPFGISQIDVMVEDKLAYSNEFELDDLPF